MMARQHAPFAFVGYGITVVSADRIAQMIPGESAFGDVLSVAASPLVLLLGCIIASYAGLVPDWDSPTSTVSVKGGFVTEGISRHIIAPISGGHRQLTHSLIFYGLMGLFGHLCSLHPIASGILFAIATFLIGKFIIPGQKLFKKKSINTAIAAVALGGGAVLALPDIAASLGIIDYSWIALAMGIGGAMHGVSDSLTQTGTPWFYPFVIQVRGVNAKKSQKALVTVAVKRVHRKKDNILKIPIFTTNDHEDNPLNSLDAWLLALIAMFTYVFVVDPMIVQLNGTSPLMTLWEFVLRKVDGNG